jgi:outer membrane protein assembly factor BamE (lipoprotein component of BamABCDE complex)
MKKLYIILIFLLLTSCTLKPVDKYHGVSFLEKKQTKLLINKSNKNDIIDILGAPSTQSFFKTDVWIYIENRKTKSSLLKFGKNIVLKNNILVLEIDKKGILKDKKFYDIEDGKKIKFSSDLTKRSEKDSFVYGVITSLEQKINSKKK